jgi:hypothetical protein
MYRFTTLILAAMIAADHATAISINESFDLAQTTATEECECVIGIKDL